MSVVKRNEGDREKLHDAVGGGGEHTPATPLTSHTPTPRKKRKPNPKPIKSKHAYKKQTEKNTLTTFVGRYG